MSEFENKIEVKLSPEWMEAVRAALVENIESFELFRVLTLSPSSLDLDDQRDLMELSEPEREFIIKTTYDELGFDSEKDEPVANYESEYYPIGSETPDPEVIAEVTIYPTDNGQVFIHQSRVDNELVDITLAPKDHRI